MASKLTDSKGSFLTSAVSLVARRSTPAAFRLFKSRSCGRPCGPKCDANESPKRSEATSVACGRAVHFERAHHEEKAAPAHAATSPRTAIAQRGHLRARSTKSPVAEIDGVRC